MESGWCVENGRHFIDMDRIQCEEVRMCQKWVFSRSSLAAASKILASAGIMCIHEKKRVAH